MRHADSPDTRNRVQAPQSVRVGRLRVGDCTYIIDRKEQGPPAFDAHAVFPRSSSDEQVTAAGRERIRVERGRKDHPGCAAGVRWKSADILRQTTAREKHRSHQAPQNRFTTNCKSAATRTHIQETSDNHRVTQDTTIGRLAPLASKGTG